MNTSNSPPNRIKSYMNGVSHPLLPTPMEESSKIISRPNTLHLLVKLLTLMSGWSDSSHLPLQKNVQNVTLSHNLMLLIMQRTERTSFTWFNHMQVPPLTMFHNQQRLRTIHIPWPFSPSSSVPPLLFWSDKLRPDLLRGGEVRTIISTTYPRCWLTQVLIPMKILEPSLTRMLIWWWLVFTPT